MTHSLVLIVLTYSLIALNAHAGHGRRQERTPPTSYTTHHTPSLVSMEDVADSLYSPSYSIAIASFQNLHCPNPLYSPSYSIAIAKGGCSRFAVLSILPHRHRTMESTADWDNGDFGESSTSSIDFGESQSAVLPLYCTLTSHAITLPHSLSPYLYSTPLYSRSRLQRCRWRM